MDAREQDRLETLAREYAASSIDLYSLLGVKQHDSAEAIHRQWKKLALRMHPDQARESYDEKQYFMLRAARDILTTFAPRSVYQAAWAAREYGQALGYGQGHGGTNVARAQRPAHGYKSPQQEPSSKNARKRARAKQREQERQQEQEKQRQKQQKQRQEHERQQQAQAKWQQDQQKWRQEQIRQDQERMKKQREQERLREEEKQRQDARALIAEICGRQLLSLAKETLRATRVAKLPAAMDLASEMLTVLQNSKHQPCSPMATTAAPEALTVLKHVAATLPLGEDHVEPLRTQLFKVWEGYQGNWMT